MNRVIRLKEWGCSLKTVKQPNHKQLLSATSQLENRNYALNTDTNGFIINSMLDNRELRKKTVVLLGDSFVESIFVDEDKRINSVIEKNMPDFQILNGGYSGATTLHLVNIIINKIIPLNPDYLVLFTPTNDQRVQMVDNGYWNKDFRLSPMVPLGKNDCLIDNYTESSHLKSVAKILRLVHSILEVYDIPHCYITTPHRYVSSSEDEWIKKNNINIISYSKKILLREKVNGICKLICEDLSINCIDLEASLKNKSDYFYDDLHLTNFSSPLVANIIFNNIKHYIN